MQDHYCLTVSASDIVAYCGWIRNYSEGGMHPTKRSFFSNFRQGHRCYGLARTMRLVLATKADEFSTREPGLRRCLHSLLPEGNPFIPNPSPENNMD